jgi:hypothetical protein
MLRARLALAPYSPTRRRNGGLPPGQLGERPHLAAYLMQEAPECRRHGSGLSPKHNLSSSIATTPHPPSRPTLQETHSRAKARKQSRSSHSLTLPYPTSHRARSNHSTPASPTLDSAKQIILSAPILVSPRGQTQAPSTLRTTTAAA